MDLNKVMLIGRLTRDPELRTTPSGQTVANFSIATSMRWKDQSGNQQEKTEFHNIVAWRKLAEIVGQYLKKGSQIYLEGRLETRSWEAQDGQKKYRTEIVADNMIMLGRSGAPTPGGSNVEIDTTKVAQKATTPAPVAASESEAKEEEISIDDIPF